MRLFELTEAPQDSTIAKQQFTTAMNNLKKHFNEKVLPAKKAVDEMYAEQYLPPIFDKYKASLKPIVKMVQGLNKGVVEHGELIGKQGVSAYVNLKNNILKQSMIKLQSIHNRAAVANLDVRYKGGNGPLGDYQAVGEKTDEFNKYIKNAFDMSSKVSTSPIDTGKVTGQTTQPEPTPPVNPARDEYNKRLNKGKTNKDKNLPAVIDKGDKAVDGEVVSPAGKERADKMLDKKGQVIDGEWEEINDAMKQLPEMPKLLVNKNPRIGDYIMWKGGKASARQGQMNYGEIIEPSPYIDTNKSVMYRSINSNPNKGREGAESHIGKEKIIKYLKKEELAKLMPQTDPIKYTKDPKVSATVGQVGNAIQKGIKAGQQLGKTQPETNPNAGLLRGQGGRFDKGNQSGYQYAPKKPIS
jgi:hypothetical protein